MYHDKRVKTETVHTLNVCHSLTEVSSVGGRLHDARMSAFGVYSAKITDSDRLLSCNTTSREFMFCGVKIAFSRKEARLILKLSSERMTTCEGVIHMKHVAMVQFSSRRYLLVRFQRHKDVSASSSNLAAIRATLKPRACTLNRCYPHGKKREPSWRCVNKYYSYVLIV